MPPGHISLVFYLFDLWHVLKNHWQSKVSTVTYYCFLNNINQNLISAAATQCEIEALSLNTSWIFSPSLQDFIKITQLSFILWCLGHIHKVFNIKEKKIFCERTQRVSPWFLSPMPGLTQSLSLGRGLHQSSWCELGLGSCSVSILCWFCTHLCKADPALVEVTGSTTVLNIRLGASFPSWK